MLDNVLNIQYIIYHERNCRTIKTNKRNTNINRPNIKKQMNEILGFIVFLLVGLYIYDKYINND